jgi:hypothetical protein
VAANLSYVVCRFTVCQTRQITAFTFDKLLMRVQLLIIPVIVLLSCSVLAAADYKDDIGYTRLVAEQGAMLSDGSGIAVTQGEAGGGPPPVYMPDVAIGEFAGKAITDKSGSNPANSSSGHATSVGKRFYGSSTSIAPAINTVNIYDAHDWLNSGYLWANSSSSQPRSVSDRIANHSWIADSSNKSVDLLVLKRLDWVIENDEFIHAVGLKNVTSTNSPMLGAAFNVIAVGATDGVHGRSTPSLAAPYVSGRTRPELVAPFSTTSSATPVIAAAAALLVEVGHAASLSSAPATSNRAGTTIYTAERSEVIKTVLMAGADRVTNNSTNPDSATPRDITDYRAALANQSANGLDVRFGAGQVNIYNSFHILMAGEQNSLEDGGGGIGSHGFDYDPAFGGAGNGRGSNVKGSYTFSTGTSPVMLTAALGWNVDVANNNNGTFLGAATLYDMNLRLFDETDGGHVPVAASVSAIDNTENIWIELDAGKDYLLEVTPKSGQSSFNWDYALSWQMIDLVDSDGDGLSDHTETALGTNPNSVDSDDDGLSDFNEVNFDGNPSNYAVGTDTDPLLADTDGDGFDDGLEVSYGSNPLLVSDTPASNYINNGDVDGDGVFNVVDILLATRMVLGELVPTPEQQVRADMVPDGVINAGDLVRIQQLVLGL